MGSLTDKNVNDFLRSIRGEYHILIETGTYMGWSTEHVASFFEKVFSIERSEEIYKTTSERLSYLTNIVCINGHSLDVMTNELQSIIEDPNHKMVWWLDSHWSGGITAGEDDECPLLKELDIIFKYREDDIILIDDARLFLHPPPPPHKPEHWPTILDIKGKMVGDYGYCTKDDIIYIMNKDKHSRYVK
jgi:hypothetical protein